jgi:hypothetical protein
MSFEAGLLMAVVAAVVIGVPLAIRRAGLRFDAEVRRLVARRARQRATGRATIKSIERTGLSINDQPQVEIALELKLPDRVHTWAIRCIVDVLDIPRIQPGTELAVRFDPDDPANIACELEEGFAAGHVPAPASRAVSATGATLEAPLWSFGHQDADAWLVPPRADATPLVVIVFSDPHHEARDSGDATLVEVAQHVVAEALWMTTDLPARTAVMVDLEAKKLVTPTGELASYEGLAPYLQNLEPRPIAVWGAARRDVATDGITIKIRRPDRPDERTLTATLPDLSGFLIGWLVGEGLCRRIEPPAWYRPPTGEALTLYAHVLHNLQLQILADKKNRALEPLAAELQHGFVDLAHDVAEAHDLAVLHLAALTSAHYAARAGLLDDRQRARALALLGRYTDDHPIHRLSPSLLASFGRRDEATARIAALRAPSGGAFRSSADPYQRWLASLRL